MAYLSVEQLDGRVSSTSGISVDFLRDWRQAASRLNAGHRTAFQHGYWLGAWYEAFHGVAPLIAVITDAAIGSVEGKGTGKLKDSFDALVKGGVHFYVSGMSAKARNITDADLAGKSAEFAMPTKLVDLAAAADVVLSY